MVCDDDAYVRNHFTPKRIIKSGPATIVFWKDGTKTVVKRAEDEPDNEYAAFTAALGIKVFGSNSALKNVVEKTERKETKQDVNYSIMVDELFKFCCETRYCSDCPMYDINNVRRKCAWLPGDEKQTKIAYNKMKEWIARHQEGGVMG